jgi:ribonuclease HII
MIEIAPEYPDYAFDCNKGYSSEAHRDALRRLGFTPSPLSTT